MAGPKILDQYGAPVARTAPGRGVRVGAYGDSAFDAASFGRELHRFYGHPGSADAVINPENDQITGTTTQPPASQPSPQTPIQDPAPNDVRKDL